LTIGVLSNETEPTIGYVEDNPGGDDMANVPSSISMIGSFLNKVLEVLELGERFCQELITFIPCT
jgi:hypothetical protein